MADISSITLPDGSSYDIKGKSSGQLAPAHIINGDVGWYEFLRIPGLQNNSRNITILINTGNNNTEDSRCGIIYLYTYRTGANKRIVDLRWLATTFELDDVRWDVVGGVFILYIKKISTTYESLFFYLINESSKDSILFTDYWVSNSVEEPTTAIAASGDINNNSATATNATNDANGDQIDTTYLKKTETAVSSYTLFPTKVYPGSLAAGWYKFAEVNITGTSGRAKITFKYGSANSSYDFIGEIFVYKTNSTTMNCAMQIPYSVSGKTTYFRYNIDSATKVSLYVYKHDAYGNPVFTFISSENALGEYLDPSTYMLESLVSETPPSTALKPYYSTINRWVNNVSVSPGTNQQILSYSAGMITASTVLAKVEFANPEYIKSDCSWETTDGANPNDSGTITLTGTCTTATTANLLLLNVVVA